MKHVLLSLFLCMLLCVPTAWAQKAAMKDYVEVIYFHGKQRCLTCRAIEKLSKEVVNQQFASELKRGKVRYRTVDISTKAGEKLADRYEVTWSSLFINRWKNGKEERHDLTQYSFAHARKAPEAYKAGIKQEIDKLLK